MDHVLTIHCVQGYNKGYMESGMDSWGYRFPVYLTVWGSGMSASLTPNDSCARRA